MFQRISCTIHAHIYHSTMEHAWVFHHAWCMVFPSCIMHSCSMHASMVHTCFMNEKRPNFSHVPCMNMKHACTLYAGDAWNMHGEARMKLAVACMKHAWWSAHEISCGMHETCMVKHAWNWLWHAWNMHGEAHMKLAVACMKHACSLCSFSSRVLPFALLRGCNCGLMLFHLGNLPYRGKLSRKKTFTNWWKIRYSWKKLSQINHSCHTKGHHAPKFAEKTFTNSHKTCESFLPQKFPAIPLASHHYSFLLHVWFGLSNI